MTSVRSASGARLRQLLSTGKRIAPNSMPLLRSHKRVLDIRRSGGAVNAEGADNAFATNIDDPTVVGSLLPEHAAADVSSNHAALPALIRVMLRGVMR